MLGLKKIRYLAYRILCKVIGPISYHVTSYEKKLPDNFTGIIEEPNGDRSWFLNGKLHRADGPAKVNADGSKVWYQNGRWIDCETIHSALSAYLNQNERDWVAQYRVSHVYKLTDEQRAELSVYRKKIDGQVERCLQHRFVNGKEDGK